MPIAGLFLMSSHFRFTNRLIVRLENNIYIYDNRVANTTFNHGLTLPFFFYPVPIFFFYESSFHPGIVKLYNVPIAYIGFERDSFDCDDDDDFFPSVRLLLIY